MSLKRRPLSNDLPLRIGLTGSIGMGKSTASKHLMRNNVPVLDSDAIVHALYAGEAVAPIGAMFPDVIVNGIVDRQKLSPYVLNNDAAMKQVEALIHPLVRQKQREFFDQALADGCKMACVDIPLLFETHAEERLDVVLVVSAHFDNQKKRVLARPDMTEAKFRSIIARQMPDAEKRQYADYIIDTNGSKEETLLILDGVLDQLRNAAQKREEGLN